MFVDIANDAIIINDPSCTLKPNQVSQLEAWGFKKVTDKNEYRLSSEMDKSILLKLIKYFNKAQISYSLSQHCENYLSEVQQQIAKFQSKKDLAELYKEGEFDTGEFYEFKAFVRSRIPRPLKEHQLKAAHHLCLVENGANFSVPGSGKTAVVLCVYEKLKSEGKVNILFVVGPPACFGPWRTEFQLTLKRQPNYRILAGGEQAARKLEYYSPSSKKSELYLTTYQTLLNDKNEVMTFFRQRRNDVFLVIDEAHYIKQIGGNWAGAVLGICEYAKFRCVLTGTPLPRSYTDIYNPFDFLWPDNEPLDSETKIRIELDEANGDGALARELLKKSIGPLFYRVRKSELGLIPALFHKPFVLEMNKYERIIYDAIENKIRDYSKEDYMRNIDLVKRLRRGRIIRLRQCVSYARLLGTSLAEYEEGLVNDESDLRRIISDYDSLEIPAKLEYLKELIQRFHRKGQKVVIWANFIGTLELIVKYLTEAGFYCKLIIGKTPIEQTSVDEEETRERIRDEFVDPKSGLDILVANPAACGESISLHKTCYHAIYYDLSYNCAQYLQSLDRIHRVGGSEVHQANYYFLQYENTIDYDIKANLDKKAKKMYDVVEEDYSIYSLDMFEEDDEMHAYERLFGGK